MSPELEHSIVDPVRRAIRDAGWITPGDHVLVGLSGGPDSVALLHVLRELRNELGFTLGACHLDHGLRGEASSADEDFCRELCDTWSIPLTLDESRVFCIDSDGTGALDETRARTHRYAFFRDAATRTHATHLALAHHRDDQVETILHRMLRGTGLAGLRGIPASRPLTTNRDTDVQIIRPLLGLTKAEIVEHLERTAIPYRIDETNERLDSPRNRIRAEILPWLAERFEGDPAAALERLAVHADEADAYLASAAREAEPTCRLEHDSYDRRKLAALPRPVLRRVVAAAFESVAGRGIELAESDRVLEGIDSDTSQELSLRGGIRISASGNAWRVQATNDATADERVRGADDRAADDRATLPESGSLEIKSLALRFEVDALDRGQLASDEPNDPDTAYFPTNDLRRPLRIRTRRNGDRIRLENGGHQKLQDLFVDRKIPRWKRDRIPLIVDAEGRVLWVVGIRRSAYTINPHIHAGSDSPASIHRIRARDLHAARTPGEKP